MKSVFKVINTPLNKIENKDNLIKVGYKEDVELFSLARYVCRDTVIINLQTLVNK